MGPRARKLALTAHVVFTVGWLGAVGCSLVLAIAGVASTDPEIVRATYLAMQLVGWWLLVPLSLASLFTGLVQALGTSWGLFRHYWVLIKLLMNVFASAVLLLYMQQLEHLARAVGDSTLTERQLLEVGTPSPIVHAGGALMLLLVAVTLSVYKPRGMTRYGQRKQRGRLANPGRAVRGG
ncbi:MAG TPA: DUF2269 domain-containing protein [Mycobacteriales bacterium]|nr:DUF2269 domain-containing protein [Mycobacteriales bacterium]